MALCSGCKKELKGRNLQDMILPFKGKVADQMLNDFYLYWSEPNARGRERWELEKVFDVGRRLSTWLRNQERMFNKR